MQSIAIATAAEPTPIKRLGSDGFRQKERVEAISYSADGKQIATADGDAIQIWDANDGKLSRSVQAIGISVKTKALLGDWAKGPVSATLTREATESLERLKR